MILFVGLLTDSISLSLFLDFDNPHVNCTVHPEVPECNCEMGVLKFPPWACTVGNLMHAQEKVRYQVGFIERKRLYWVLTAVEL